jgi:hypothetical protein
MENNSNSWTLLAVIFIAMLVAILLAALIAGAPRSDFNSPVDISDIEAALASRGLHICAQEEFAWTSAPGFVFGKFYDINTNCSTYDPNKPGARVWVVEYESVEARNAALRNFETTRRHIGSGIAWSNGPYVVLADGNQKAEEISILKEAISSTGAK